MNDWWVLSSDQAIMVIISSMDEKRTTSVKGRNASHHPSQFGQTSLVCIEKRFYLTTLRYSHSQYNAYNGIDTLTGRWVTAYLRGKNSKYLFSSKFKEEIRNGLCPKVIWEGQVTLNQTVYTAQIQEGCGPSLKQLKDRLRNPLTCRELLHLLFQLLKLIERLAIAKYASGVFSLQNIHFSSDPKRNQLLLLNCFNLRRRNEPRKPFHTQYCSQGSHLGRNLQTKDDLQSIVYILLDLYLPLGLEFGSNPHQFHTYKTGLQMDKFSREIPQVFIQFYCDVESINVNGEFNFFHWKNYLGKLLTPFVTNQPYPWLMSSTMNSSNSSKDEILQYQQSLSFELSELEEENQQRLCVKASLIQQKHILHKGQK